MKKLSVIIMMILIPCVGGALTMCVRDSSLVVSLDQSINGPKTGQNAAEMLWWTEFSYGRIYGEATCLSEAEGGKASSLGATTNSNGEKLSQDIPAGLKNTDADGNERRYCWCRMTHPASSLWVFSDDRVSAAACASSCVARCGLRSQSDAPLRGGLFGSVGK